MQVTVPFSPHDLNTNDSKGINETISPEYV